MVWSKPATSCFFGSFSGKGSVCVRNAVIYRRLITRSTPASATPPTAFSISAEGRRVVLFSSPSSTRPAFVSFLHGFLGSDRANKRVRES